jgi:hypothetical protein
MTILKTIKYFIFLTLAVVQFSCSIKSFTPLTNSSAHFDMEFNNKFDMRKPGFTGGDATYSVQLPDGRTVWMFGDTFIGEVTDELTREKTNPMYIRNCFVVQDGDEMKTLHKGKLEDFISMAVPKEVERGVNTELEVWFWPGDGIVHNNRLKVFMSKFHQAKEGMWGFEFLETVLIEYSLPDLKELRKIEIPYSKQSGIHFGHALYQTADYIYVYGLRDQKPYVARAKTTNLSKDWEFYTGDHWDNDISKIQPMLNINGSEQFSVFKLNNKYVLLTQLGSLSKTVCSLIGNTPYGPWKNKQVLFETPIVYNNEDLFTYNALAHPQFTTNDELLVSYNTNSFNLEDHFKNAGIYKPRFMRVPINMIFNKKKQ